MERLKELLISTYRKFGSEKAIVIKGGQSYTGDQIADEIQNETPFGMQMIDNIVKLTIDLLKRDKINIADQTTADIIQADIRNRLNSFNNLIQMCQSPLFGKNEEFDRLFKEELEQSKVEIQTLTDYKMLENIRK